MTKEQAIRILSSETSMEEIHKIKYYEYYDSIGWKFVFEDDDNYSREIIEDEFNIKVA